MNPYPADTPADKHSAAGRAWPWLGLVLILIFTGIIRLPSFHRASWNVDEAAEAIVAQEMTSGKVIYRDTVTHRAPLQHILFALLFSAAGHTQMAAAHLLFLACLMATIFVLFLTGRIIQDSVLGFWAAFLFALQTANLPRFESLAFHTEYLLAFFSVLALLLLLLAEKKERASLYFLAGISAALAVLSKQTGLMDAAALGLALIAAHGPHPFAVKLRNRLLPFLLGLLAVAAAVCVYFGLHHALREFFYFFWTFNTGIYIHYNSLGHRLSEALAFFVQTDTWLRYPFIPLAMVYALRLWSGLRRGCSGPGPFLVYYFLFALGLSYFGACLSGRSSHHYYIPCMIPASLAFGLLLKRSLSALRQGRHKRTAYAGSLAFLIYCLAWFGFHAAAIGTRLEMPSIPMPHRAAVEYIRSHTRPGDRIMAWGFYPEYYVWTQRDPASRFSLSNYLTGQNMGPGYDFKNGVIPQPERAPYDFWDAFMHDLNTNRPVYLVDASSLRHPWAPDTFAPLRNERMRDFLEAHYFEEKTFEFRKQEKWITLWRIRPETFSPGTGLQEEHRAS